LLHIKVNQAILNLRDQSARFDVNMRILRAQGIYFPTPVRRTCSRLGGLWLICERNYSEAADRLDEARVVIFNIADADDHWPANHLIGRTGGEQRLELGYVGRLFAEPTPAMSRASKQRDEPDTCSEPQSSAGGLRILSPAGERQVSHNPAMPISRRLASAIA
jgi:hypothetical protein